MRKIISVFLMCVLLLSVALVGSLPAHASASVNKSKAIAFLFDNSGSMFWESNLSWSRATYAMEVFASMLNTGDILQIYPMSPIYVGDKQYTMNNPLEIKDATQSSLIREIYTKESGGTPIESIDCAIQGLQGVQADKKYFVILTDGATFAKNGVQMNVEGTQKELDKRIRTCASQNITFMYLGVGNEASIPNEKESEYFIKRLAANTEDVLSTLTYMCNLIFGRDTLPKSRMSGKTINFDISISKLIVFVQGENISDLKIKSDGGGTVGKLTGAQQTKYPTKGAGNYDCVTDTSLQGMIVTYEDCAAGTYTIDYSGTATSIEVYYEPDADLEFIFTDSEGNNVDLDALYEGEYKVSFGLKDAKTGKLISSDLLGNPHYEGSYTLNGEKTIITHDGYSGEVPITLKANDTFKADLTVNYLSGYSITKTSADFGWPEDGIKVSAPPLGKFNASLKVSQHYIVIKELEQTPAFIVDLTIDGKKLTAEEFDAVTLTVDCGGIDYTLTPQKEESRYLIKLKSMDGIAEDDYRINVDAKYLDEYGRETQATDYNNVTLSNTPLWVKWALILLFILILIIIIWIISHIKVLPNRAHISKGESRVLVDGEDVTKFCNFSGSPSDVVVKYGGNKIGLSFPTKPGKESYLYKNQTKRYAEVTNPSTIKRIGNANIESATIGSVRYVLNDKNVLERKPASKSPLNLKHGMPIVYSGTITSAGVKKSFNINTKFNFKKK